MTSHGQPAADGWTHLSGGKKREHSNDDGSDHVTEIWDESVDQVTVRLPASPRYLRVARVVAGALADEMGADIDELEDVRLAVGEVCSLAVTAGARAIELRFEISGDSLTVSGEATPAPVDFESHLGFTEQILQVVATDYELDTHPGAVSFRLHFRNGS